MISNTKITSNSSARVLKFMRKLISYGLSAGIILGVILLWEFALPESMQYVLPRPSVILKQVWESQSSLLGASRYTIFAAFFGFLLGNLIAILLAVWIIYSQTASDTVYPMAVILRCIPLVALTPFIVMFFGQGIMSKVIMAALMCFFPTLVNMVQGLTSIEQHELEFMHTLNANERQVFWKMRVPYSLPYLFTSFKITSSAAVLGAIMGEWMGAWHGLGAIIVNAMFNMQGNLLWAAMVVATAMSILAYVITAILEPIFIPWHESVKKSEGA